MGAPGPSLLNVVLMDVVATTYALVEPPPLGRGFSTIYECFNPPHLNFGNPGLEHKDRCTFVAIKDNRRNLVTSPAANALSEKHPEGTLSYSPV